jgi:hypothetical protein
MLIFLYFINISISVGMRSLISSQLYDSNDLILKSGYLKVTRSLSYVANLRQCY